MNDLSGPVDVALEVAANGEFAGPVVVNLDLAIPDWLGDPPSLAPPGSGNEATNPILVTLPSAGDDDSLATFSSLREIDGDSVKDLLDVVVAFLESLEVSIPLIDTELPLVNKSIRELLGIADPFAGVVDGATAEEPMTLSEAEQKLKEGLGSEFDANFEIGKTQAIVGAELDAAATRARRDEFDRVGQQVEQHLHEPVAVGAHLRHAGAQRRGELHVLVPEQLAGRRDAQWRSIKPDYVDRLKIEWKTIRETEALKEAKQKLEETQAELADVIEKYQVSESELVQLRRAAMADRILESTSGLPVQFRKALRDELVKLYTEEAMQEAVQRERNKYKSLPKEKITVDRGTGVAVKEQAPAPIKTVKPAVVLFGLNESQMPLPDETAEQYKRRISF